jgi:hypothetical protein
LHRGAVPAGTFVFVLSDFLALPSRASWLHALGARWDVIPVVIQDPRWEQSFPDVSGVPVGLCDPRTGRVKVVRLSKREAAARKAANEERWRDLMAAFRRFGLEPAVVTSSETTAVLTAFLSWSERRRYARTWGW